MMTDADRRPFHRGLLPPGVSCARCREENVVIVATDADGRYFALCAGCARDRANLRALVARAARRTATFPAPIALYDGAITAWLEA